MKYAEVVRARVDYERDYKVAHAEGREFDERWRLRCNHAHIVYRLAPGKDVDYKLTVETLGGYVHSNWGSYNMEGVPATVWVQVGEIMSALELWKSGAIDRMPQDGDWPNCDWADVRHQLEQKAVAR